MAKQPEPLGNAQLEVLQYVTDHHPISVGEVAEYFARTSGKARTTVLTVMERLRQKGYLTRRKSRGTYRYSPRLARGEMLSGVVGRFVNESLGGSISPFIAYLAETRNLTDSEVARLRQLVGDIEQNTQERRR